MKKIILILLLFVSFNSCKSQDYVGWVGTGIFTCTDSLRVGLVSYYKLNGTTGSVVDSKGLVDLSVVGSVVRGESGILGNSFYFSGATGVYLTGAHPLSGKTSWTISAWMKMNISQTTSQHFISGDATSPQVSPNLLQRSLTKPSVGWSNSSFNFNVSSGTDLSLYTWYLVTERAHLDIPSNTIYYKLSVNNIHYSYGNQVGAGLTSVGGNLIVGKHGKFTTFNFNGWVDDIKIWDRELSDCEIDANWNGGLGIEL